MKIRTISENFIIEKWNVQRFSFEEISQMNIPCAASLKRIRNIVYGGPKRCKSAWQHDVYRCFRIKFLELKDVTQAIYWVFNNQPDMRVSERTVRRVIDNFIKNPSKKVDV